MYRLRSGKDHMYLTSPQHLRSYCSLIWGIRYHAHTRGKVQRLLGLATFNVPPHHQLAFHNMYQRWWKTPPVSSFIRFGFYNRPSYTTRQGKVTTRETCAHPKYTDYMYCLCYAFTTACNHRLRVLSDNLHLLCIRVYHAVPTFLAGFFVYLIAMN